MRKKYKQRIDPVTGYPTLPWYGAVIGGFGVYTLLVSFAFVLPNPSLELALPLLAIGLIGSINFVWFRTKPNLFSKFIMQITVSMIFAVISYRSFQFLLPEQAKYLGVAIVITLLFAHTLPMWKPSFTKFVRDALALTSVKTKIQALIYRYSWYLLVVIFIFGAALELSFHRSVGMFFIFGALFWLLAILMPFSDQHPSSPWEKQGTGSNNS